MALNCPFCSLYCEGPPFWDPSQISHSKDLECPKERQSAAKLLLSPAKIEISGEVAELGEAVGFIVQHVRKARLPLVNVSGNLSCEEMQAAVSMASQLKSFICLPDAEASLAVMAASNQAGRLNRTLGDLRGQVDCVVVLGAELEKNHPRLCERLGIIQEEIFRVYFKDDTPLLLRGDLYSTFHLPDPATALHSLRLQAAGKGLGTEKENHFLEILTSARNGLVIFGEEFTARSSRVVKELFLLLNEVGHGRSWSVMFLPASPNGLGAAEFLPTFQENPGMAGISLQEECHWPLLERRGLDSAGSNVADLIINIGEPYLHKHQTSYTHVVQIGGIKPDIPPLVYIPTCRAGWSAAGSVVRFDGVPVMLGAVVSESYPSMQDILIAVEGELPC